MKRNSGRWVIGKSYSIPDEAAFAEWLEGDNLCFCDTIGALGSEQLLNHPHVRCMQVSTGRTRQAFDRLSAKVLANLSEYNG